MFCDIVAIYKRASDHLKRRPDAAFEGGEGVDAGGPNLEFFWLTLQQMKRGNGQNINLFEGDSGHILPIHCASYLDSGLFYVFGKVVAHSILHGGCGFPGLSPAMSEFIADGETDSVSSLVSNKEIAVHQIIVHEILLKRKQEVDDIRRGMQMLSHVCFLKINLSYP